MISTATFLALAIKCASTIHPDTAVDIARVESGFYPYAIGIVGEKGKFPQTKAEALKILKMLNDQGKNYSVGLMQINKSNFDKFNVTASDMLSPCNNLSVFEKIVTDCYIRGKTLKNALSCYYSGNFVTGRKPESDFKSTSYIERIGYQTASNYVVPSTKEDVKETGNIDTPTESKTIYPSHLMRGELLDSNVNSTPTKQDNTHVNLQQN